MRRLKHRPTMDDDEEELVGAAPDSVDPLTRALQNSIVRCRRLLDQLADRHGEQLP